MAEQIQFLDGAAYETMMGAWSRLVGLKFLGWMSPRPGLSWLEVGCGNGAFTELIAETCAPKELVGIDPAEPQLTFARERPGVRHAVFLKGYASALPFGDGAFDATVSALVLFFVPDPAQALMEMVRVTRTAGTVSSYVWDLQGGGFPWEAIEEELRRIGIKPLSPPNAAVADLDRLRGLWMKAGLDEVETSVVTAQRHFPNFEEFWRIGLTVPGISPVVKDMREQELAEIKAATRARMKPAAGGSILVEARAHAVRGVVSAR